MLNVVVVGAGPYGLSIAAHLRHYNIPFRIFGRPMDSWLEHMPKGMKLKSDGFASNIYDPTRKFTLEKFCAERGIEYGHTGIPVRLDTFCEYGTSFRDRLVPELETKLVTSIERRDEGFELRIDDGESVMARNVVLAIGITHFQYVPSCLAQLPHEYLSHSYEHYELDSFKQRKVAIIGGGSSALDLAGLLHQAGVDVRLITRRKELKFHNAPTGKPRSLYQRLRHPQSGLGPGMRSRFFSDAPMAFHYLPKKLRLEAVRRTLGPSGGWFVRDMVIGKVPLLMESTPERAEIQNGKVRLSVRHASGSESQVEVDHVIAATGYKVDLDRLSFLSTDLRSNINSVDRTPVLNSKFESSVPGLYFVGIAAANSFGPVMRFAFGAGFSAKRVSAVLAKSASESRAELPMPATIESREETETVI